MKRNDRTRLDIPNKMIQAKYIYIYIYIYILKIFGEIWKNNITNYFTYNIFRYRFYSTIKKIITGYNNLRILFSTLIICFITSFVNITPPSLKILNVRNGIWQLFMAQVSHFFESQAAIVVQTLSPVKNIIIQLVPTLDS